MPRYEDGKRFWQIATAGTTVTVTVGALGKRGRTTVKTLPTAEAAKAHHAKLVGEQQRGGFQLVDATDEPAGLATAEPGALPDERAAALEARLLEDPSDANTWMVYGDLLQKRGDPRGELAALQQAADAERAANPRGRGGAMLALTKHFAKHVPALLGALGKHVADVRELAKPPFFWKHGFIYRAELGSFDAGARTTDPEATVRELTSHPSGRFLAELAVKARDLEQASGVLTAIAQVAPPGLQELDFHARAELGDLGELWPRLPRLRRLSLTARSFEVGTLNVPAVQRARFLALSLSPRCVETIATAPWPVLERMELRLGNRYGIIAATFEDLEPLLRRTDMPTLTHLKIRLAPFAGAICRVLIASPLAAQLHVLDLAHGTITPQDVNVLAAAKTHFPQLRELWLPAAALRGTNAKQLEGIAKHVISDARAPLDTLEEELGFGATIESRFEGDRE